LLIFLLLLLSLLANSEGQQLHFNNERGKEEKQSCSEFNEEM
jgi:hypothetical protein